MVKRTNKIRLFRKKIKLDLPRFSFACTFFTYRFVSLQLINTTKSITVPNNFTVQPQASTLFKGILIYLVAEVYWSLVISH
jgi:hypothetical protein